MSSLLPINSTQLEKDIEAVIAARFNALLLQIKNLWNPDTCPVSLLPWLAWALSVEEWDPDWPEFTKREVVKNAVKLHFHKGTPWAVEQAIIAAGSPNARVVEWWEYSGLPYHFKIEVDALGDSVPNETVTRMQRAIDQYKNVRSVQDALDFNLSVQSSVYFAAGYQSSETITVYPQPA